MFKIKIRQHFRDGVGGRIRKGTTQMGLVDKQLRGIDRVEKNGPGRQAAEMYRQS